MLAGQTGSVRWKLPAECAIAESRQVRRIPVDMIQVRIEADRETLDAVFLEPAPDFQAASVAAMARPADGPLDGAHFIEPVSLVVTVTAATLAYRLVEHWLTKREFGVQIDARTTPPTVSNIAGIPAGFVVIIDANGSASTHPAQSLSSGGLASLLGSITGK